MRWALLFVLASCGNDAAAAPCVYNGRGYEIGETFPAGDGCNSCSCTASGTTCTRLACPDASPFDANPASCAMSGGCPSGPVCGAKCCGQGERCDNGVCKCGMNAGCGAGDSCEAPGPMGGDRCGSICCGVSGPCPQ